MALEVVEWDAEPGWLETSEGRLWAERGDRFLADVREDESVVFLEKVKSSDWH
jgi:hypothetical protein